jgi:hypothetical protein
MNDGKVGLSGSGRCHGNDSSIFTHHLGFFSYRHMQLHKV